MVEKMNGQGRDHRDVSRHFVAERNLSSLVFSEDDVENGVEDRVLAKLAEMPEFDERSLHISGLASRGDRTVNLLLVPKECPQLREVFNATDELPPEDETWVVVASDYSRSKSQIYPVLVESEDGASRIATKAASTEFRCYKGDISTRVVKVTPEQFIDVSKALLIRGRTLSTPVLRWGGLEAFSQELKRLNYVCRELGL